MRLYRASRDCGVTAVTIMLAAMTPCAADLTFCNRSDADMHLSLGILKRDDGWTSQGWWSLGPDECRMLVHGLPARTYYAFAIDAVDGGLLACRRQRRACRRFGLSDRVPGQRPRDPGRFLAQRQRRPRRRRAGL